MIDSLLVPNDVAHLFKRPHQDPGNGMQLLDLQLYYKYIYMYTIYLAELSQTLRHIRSFVNLLNRAFDRITTLKNNFRIN